MNKVLKIGTSDFKKLIQLNGYYVDKSLFIKELIQTGDEVILITRPRRFGKTLNLSTLKYFFDIRYPENKKLFKNLLISKEDVFEQHCCKYPTIFLSFKSVKGANKQEIFDAIFYVINELFQEFEFLLKEPKVSQTDKNFINKFLSETATLQDYKVSLKRLIKILAKFYNSLVVVLIDEYDIPLHSSFPEFYEDVIDFVRSVLANALKDNDYLYKAVLTGILRVSKESIFSDLNNFTVSTILDKKFADKFGFTENDLEKILTDFNLLKDKDLVKQWYNGYKSGNIETVYNPWSILNFVANREIKPYWINTSSNELIFNILENQKSENLINDLKKLLEGNELQKEIEENFVFSDLKEKNNLIWTLLLFSGYLTFTKQKSLNTYFLKIPNKEVAFIYKKIFIRFLEKDFSLKNDLLKKLVNSLISGNYKNFKNYLEKIVQSESGNLMLGRDKEKIYQAFLLGLFSILNENFHIKSEQESGQGRYDIAIYPKKSKDKAWIFELKYSEKTDKQHIEKLLNQSLNQIKQKKYYETFTEMGIKKIDFIAILFVKKQVYLKVFEKI